MKAHLIMPVHNQFSFTKQAVESIIANAGFPFEIVLIDNGSTDNTEKFFSANLPSVRYIRNSSNQSFAKAINQGLSLVGDASHIGILNNDILVYKDWLKKLVDHLNDRVRMIAPLQAHGKDERKCIESIYNIRERHPYLKLLEIKKTWSLEKINEHLLSNFLGKTIKLEKALGFYSCILERRTFDQIGFLDEDFINGGEDDDYARRVEKIGWEFHVALDVCVRHFGCKTIYATRIRSPEWNLELLYRKHPEFYRQQGYTPKPKLTRPIIKGA